MSESSGQTQGEPQARVIRHETGLAAVERQDANDIGKHDSAAPSIRRTPGRAHVESIRALAEDEEADAYGESVVTFDFWNLLSGAAQYLH